MKRAWQVIEIEVVRSAPSIGIALAVVIPLLLAFALLLFGGDCRC